MTSDYLRLCTYNCRGWRSGSNYVSSILDSYDLIFIQERWLLPDHLGALNISDDFISVGVSGIDTSEVLVGRPYGGCGILLRKSLSSCVHRLNSHSKRFCAIALTFTNSVSNSPFNTLLINVYLSTDYSTPESNNSFLETLAELEGFISSYSYDNLILCGNFNVDFDRGGHNANHLLSFMRDLNLVRADLCSNVKYTYRRDDQMSRSWPDHIITLSHYVHLINDVACNECVDNFSDHLLLSCTMRITHPLRLVSSQSQYPVNSQVPDTRRVDWSRVSDHDCDNYCDYIRQHIPVLSDTVITCCDPKCKKHFSDLDTACRQLLDCLDTGAQKCFPKFRSYHSTVPGWNLQARSFRCSANFWHKLWCDCGCPTSGILFQIKKKTKRRYKYEVCRLKRQKEHLKCERIGEALSQSRNRDFWKEVRKLTKSTQGHRADAPVIDGFSEDDEVSNLFSTKLNNILSSGCNLSARSDLFSSLDSSLCISDLKDTFISPSITAESLSHLKLGKSEGTNLLSNHFVYASPVLSNFLSDLFTAMLRHGYVPISLRDCILHQFLNLVRTLPVLITIGQLLLLRLLVKCLSYAY